MLIWLTPAFSLATEPTAIAEPIANAEIQKQLVGKWFEDLYSHGIHIKATANYAADGQVEIEGMMTTGKRKLKLAITGSWKVEDGKLVETVATANRQCFAADERWLATWLRSAKPFFAT
jgi:hypothetical protein